MPTGPTQAGERSGALFAVFVTFAHDADQDAHALFVRRRRHHVDMAPSTRLDQDALFRVLEQQLDVISRQQALAAGLTKHALAHRLRPGGPWRGLLPGVYMAATGAPTTLQQEMAALLYAGPGSIDHRAGGAAQPPYPDRADRVRRCAGPLHTAASRHKLRPAAPHDPDARPDLGSRPGAVRDAGPRRRRCRPRHDQPAGRARGRGRRRATRQMHDKQTSPPSSARGRTKARCCSARRWPTWPTGSGRPPKATSGTCWPGPGCPCRCSTRRCTTNAEPSSPGPTPGGRRYGIAVEVDSREWHTSPEDHAKTLARGRRMARYQIVVLRFTPRQIRSQPAEVINDIKAALDGAQGRPLLKLKTIPVNNGAAA